MVRPDIDWSVLRGALIVLSVTLVAAAAVVFGAAYFEQQAQATFEKDQRRFLTSSRKYLAVDEEERIIREFYPEFQRLSREGLIGEERRLDWTESLRVASSELRLPSLQYDIMPRDAYTPPLTLTEGAFKVFGSKMRLSVGMVHEEDLFRLFDALDRLALGRFNVESCRFHRARARKMVSPERANLGAECELIWFTVREPSPEELGL